MGRGCNPSPSEGVQGSVSARVLPLVDPPPLASWQPRGRVLGLAVLGLCTLLSAQNLLAAAVAGRGPEQALGWIAAWGELWLRELPLWLGWACCVPAVAAVSARTEAWRWGPRAAAHLGLGTLCHLWTYGLMALAGLLIDGGGEEQGSRLLFGLVRSYGTGLIIYCMLAALLHARMHGARARRASDLEAALARAELDALRTRLRPHFLFNALNTAVALVGAQPQAARSVLGDLAALLRRSLRSGEAPVPLSEEIELCLRYLAIQRQRFGDRVRVVVRVDPQVLDYPVPPLLLQPLVENAILHGLDARPEGITLELRGRVVGPGRCELVVADDGPGLDADARAALLSNPSRRGIGLGSVFARLEASYGPSARVDLRSASPGLEVVLELPGREVRDA